MTPCGTLRSVSASPFLAVALDAARGAGRLLREEIGGARRIRHKRSVIDLVTEMDQRAEAFIVERLLGAFPDHAILAEEGGATDGRSEYRWLIDPLDGTTNYAHGLPIFAVSVALERAGVVELGVGYDPSRDECFVAERGRGATMNGEAIRVSERRRPRPGAPRHGLSLRHPHHGGHEPARVRGALGPGPGGSPARLGGARPLLGGLRAARRLLGVLARPVGHGGGRAHRRRGGGPRHERGGGPWRLEGPGILASNGLVHAAVLSALRAARAARP